MRILYWLGVELKKIFPRPMIKFLKKENKENLIGVEIGSYQGRNAESILKTLKIKNLYLIDPYIHYDEGGKNPFGSLINAERRVRKLTKKYKQIIFYKDFSSKVLNKIPNNLDFVYIDGNHNYEFVKEDVNNYWKKIKVGGILGGHDFYNGLCKEHDGVVRAVIEFVSEKKLKLYVSHPDWWVKKEGVK